MEDNNTRKTITIDAEKLVELCLKAKTEKNGSGSDYGKDEKTGAELSLSISQILKALLHRWWIILLITVVCASGVFLYSYFTSSTVYTAVAKMYVNNDSVNVGSVLDKINVTASLSSTSSLIPSYLEVAKSKKTLAVIKRTLSEEYGYDYSIYELSKMINGGEIADTVFFTVQITTDDAQRAIRIVNIVVDILPVQISEIFAGAGAKVVDYAGEATAYSTNVKSQTLIGALIGIVIAVILIVCVDCIFNDFIEDSDWLTESFGNIPVLSEIPNVDENGKNSKKYGNSSYRYYAKTDSKDSK